MIQNINIVRFQTSIVVVILMIPSTLVILTIQWSLVATMAKQIPQSTPSDQKAQTVGNKYTHSIKIAARLKYQQATILTHPTQLAPISLLKKTLRSNLFS